MNNGLFQVVECFQSIELLGILSFANNLNMFDNVALLNGIDYFLSFNHMTKDRMSVVEPWSFKVGDKELASIRTRTRIGHGKNSRSVMLKRRIKLVFERITRTT